MDPDTCLRGLLLTLCVAVAVRLWLAELTGR
jgi:hypothetical protein